MSIEGRKDNRSFNIPDKKYYTGGVKGNGYSLGTTDGRTNHGIKLVGNTSSAGMYDAAFDKLLPATSTNGSTAAPANSIFGIVSDASKSGIIVEPDTQITMIIKY